MESTSRQELLTDLQDGGRYGDIAGVYHEHLSGKVVGHPDKEMMEALPASCRWFAHKGAGYDSVDVTTAKARGPCQRLEGGRTSLRLTSRDQGFQYSRGSGRSDSYNCRFSPSGNHAAL